MNKPALLLLVILIIFSCQSKKNREGQTLFNGKDLTGWDIYIGPVYDTVKNEFDTLSIPGLNNDVNKVFSVVMTDGQSALRVSGENFGGISTVSEFTNYHLQLQFKWGEKKSPPRKQSKRDSGLLYHAVGPHGADFGFWMRSQEFQIQEGDCGDYWGVAGGVMDIPAVGDSIERYIYEANASPLKFSGTSVYGRRCKKSLDAENPSGEWNTLDLFCLGDTAVHMVNNKMVMMLYHSRQDANGKEIPLVKGKIQLQSEGAEVFYRNIKLESITALPDFKSGL